MNTLYLLIATVVVFVALLFFSFVILLWGARQLLTIGQQNDTMIDLLHQISLNLGNQAHMQQTGGRQDLGDAAPTRLRELELSDRIDAYRPSEPLFADAKMK